MIAPSRMALGAGLAAMLLAGCAEGPRARGHRLDLGGPGSSEGQMFNANPSTVIAAELAFARDAREKGTWTAFRTWSTDDAQWPSPGLENVKQALAGQSDPAEPIVWGPDAVWLSCDGSFALSTGLATYPTGRRGRFATIWQRQRNGDYRWVLDQGFELEGDYAEPEMIGAKVADCPADFDRSPRRAPDVQRSATWGSGRSSDGTLEWTTAIARDCSRTFTARMKQGDAMTEVFRREAPAPTAPEGPAPPACPA